MTMRAVWTDEDGDEVELSNHDDEGEEIDGMVLAVGGKDAFRFDASDAESFAAYLRAWALRQREGMR